MWDTFGLPMLKTQALLDPTQFVYKEEICIASDFVKDLILNNEDTLNLEYRSSAGF